MPLPTTFAGTVGFGGGGPPGGNGFIWDAVPTDWLLWDSGVTDFLTWV